MTPHFVVFLAHDLLVATERRPGQIITPKKVKVLVDFLMLQDFADPCALADIVNQHFYDTKLLPRGDGPRPARLTEAELAEVLAMVAE